MSAYSLRKLERGWDGDGGLPPTEANIAMAERLATILKGLGRWQFVPCSDGSVQIELHDLHWDIEVWVTSP